MVKEYFYKKTGLYIDWDQLKKLPEIDTLVDIGVGDIGSPMLYERFPKQKLILVDPLDEAEHYAKNNLSERDFVYFKTAVGKEKSNLEINIENEINRSTLMEVKEVNFEGLPIEKRLVEINTLDFLLKDLPNLNKIGIKIDTEGYELDVILGSREILKNTKFVIAEVRHNHESFEKCYKLHQFMNAMQNNAFQLSMILTAKPLIADLCFQPIKDLK
tara:strand:- start:250 stop:897 length:648 start_codon:yes stop_codon:yes gene_type:complete